MAKTRGMSIGLKGYNKLMDKLRALDTNVQQKVARAAAMRTVETFLHPRWTAQMQQFEGQDVTVDATVTKLLPKRKYRNGATMAVPYNRLVRTYKQRYGDKPAPKEGEQLPYYYPWVLEFGTPTWRAPAPMRTAANAIKGATRKAFARELKRELRAARKSNYMEEDA